MPVKSREELQALSTALYRMRTVPNPNWDNRDPRIRELLREYLWIWKGRK